MKCPRCNGNGTIPPPSYMIFDREEDAYDEDCPDCDGSGEVEGRPEGAEDGPITKWLMRMALVGGLCGLLVYLLSTLN